MFNLFKLQISNVNNDVNKDSLNCHISWQNE